MVRYVLNAIPIHYMSTYILAQNIIGQFAKITRKIWWADLKNKIHGFVLIHWQKIFVPKAMRQLGFLKKRQKYHIYIIFLVL